MRIPGKSIVQYIHIFKTHDSMISDRYLVPEIEIEIRQMPFDGYARASSSVHNWEDFSCMTNDDEPYHN